MNLSPLLKEKRLRVHATSLEELDEIRAIIRRDLHDASIEALSADRRFASAYDGGLQLCRLVLACAGYRVPPWTKYHETSFQAAEVILDKAAAGLSSYFARCRKKRHLVDYEIAGVVTDSEMDDLVKKAYKFRDIAEAWIIENHCVFEA